MSNHPVNLLVRFLMELAMLVILGMWGWYYGDGAMKYVLGIGLPVVAATLWGIFRIPNDPKPAPVAIPGIVRLMYELFLFAFATWALWDVGHTTMSIIMGITTIASYTAGYDRTLKMLRNQN